jgi:CDP-glycerol glycerophosphotransferase (TagB/SpsB family)
MAWSDIGDDYNTKQFEEIFSAANVSLLSNSGIDVIVKPHYLDFDNFKILGLRAISDDEISSAETTLYSLLARSRALVTDYSSVWIDYLHLDKPIAFYAPDEELFWKHRPKDANFSNLSLPGVEIASDKVFLAFIEDLLANRDAHQQARAEVRAALGLISHESNTEELLRALSIIRS